MTILSSFHVRLNEGIRLQQERKFPEAAKVYEDILAEDPRHFDALHLLGVVRSQTGQLEEATRLINDALKIQEHPAALFSLAAAFTALNRTAEALSAYDRILALQPDHADSYINRGALLSQLSRHAEALKDFERVIALRPQSAEALSNHGNALCKLNRQADAIHSYDRAISLRPDYVRAMRNRVIALRGLNRLPEALATSDRVMALDPENAEVHNEHANILSDLRRYDEAIAHYRRAIALNPTYDDPHWNESLVHLIRGEFEKGWPGYEYRWRKSGERPVARDFAKPLWTGAEDLTGKTIVLHAEQGFGDAIQFCRYAKLVAARGGRVVLEVPFGLLSLLRQVEGVSEIIAAGAPLPAFDYQCPLLSLPRAFGTHLDSIPAEIPYLTADPEKVAQWRGRLDVGEARDQARKIGLVWSGSTIHSNDRNRSISLATALRAIPSGMKVYSLQKEVRTSDLATLRDSNQVIDLAHMLEDFSDTAALASLMDVVISVDTSVAHLAGALGRPTWLLLPVIHDWRWLMDRDDSPWYPTMRLFRQPAFDDWDSVMGKVNTALAQTSRYA